MKNSRLALTALLALAVVGLAACGGGGNTGVGGNVSGLNAGLSVTLQNNNAETLTVSANGSFKFSTQLAAGTGYAVTVLTQPVGQVCQVANGTGTVDSNADAVTSVTVACVSTASVGGTVSGLAVGTAVTLSNGTVLLPVATNGPFLFPGVLVAGTAFTITVSTQPAGQTCTVTNGTGTVSASSTTAVTVTCS